MTEIRTATAADAQAILDIYAPYITGSCATFETEVPAIDKFAARIEDISKDYPYLVCADGGRIVGFAYASRYREREAYRYSAAVSVYIAPEYHRRGVGRALYSKLFELLREQGIYTVYAAITIPNEESVGLHSAFGFRRAGAFRNVGYKFGRWLDVCWMEKPLRDYDEPRIIKTRSS